MTSTIPPKESPKFIERVFEKKHFFFLTCFGFFCDITYRLVCGKNISRFKLSDLDTTISYGNIFIGVIVYLSWMSYIPRLRFHIQKIFRTPLRWIYTEKINFDYNFISMDKLKQYACDHNSIILWNEVLQKEHQDKDRYLLNDLRFALSIFWLVDLLFSECYLNTIILMFPEVWYKLFFVFNLSLPALMMIYSLIERSYFYDRFMYLPEHPIALQQREEYFKEQEKREKFRSIINSHRN